MDGFALQEQAVAPMSRVELTASCRRRSVSSFLSCNLCLTLLHLHTHVFVPNGLPCGSSRVIHLHHRACNAMQAESLSKHICTPAAAGVVIIEYAYLTHEKQRLVRLPSGMP